ncbi:queuosine biosynthesis protein QueC [Haloarcula virus HCTV-16]|nr:queuosine biosynthesis protein QueC [Haloarcula virus HCTV-16]
MTKAIVLLSGGIDSATCLAIALDTYDEVQPVHYNYGQQTADFEAEQAHNLAQHFRDEGENVSEVLTIDYSEVFSVFGRGVASDRDSFVTEDGDLEEEDGRSTGYVPMRNLHLIGTGAAVADVSDGDAVYHGMQQGDEASYPDCRPQFATAVEEAVNASLADSDSVDVRTPLLHQSKVEVIERGEALGVPWEFTYSCYEAIDGDEPEPCGSCPACIERAEAFYAARVTDPFGTVQAVQEASPVEWERIMEEVSFRD